MLKFTVMPMCRAGERGLTRSYCSLPSGHGQPSDAEPSVARPCGDVCVLHAARFRGGVSRRRLVDPHPRWRDARVLSVRRSRPGNELLRLLPSLGRCRCLLRHVQSSAWSRTRCAGGWRTTGPRLCSTSTLVTRRRSSPPCGSRDTVAEQPVWNREIGRKCDRHLGSPVAGGSDPECDPNSAGLSSVTFRRVRSGASSHR